MRCRCSTSSRGMERAVAAALRSAGVGARWRTTRRRRFALLERAAEAGLGSLVVLISPTCRGSRARCPSSRRSSSCRRSSRPSPSRATATTRRRASSGSPVRRRRPSCSSSQARRRALAAELDGAAAEGRGADPECGVLARGRPDRRAAASCSPSGLSALLGIPADRFEAPLRARVDAGGARSGQLAAELRRLGAAEAELRREQAEHNQRAGAIDVELRASRRRGRRSAAPARAVGRGAGGGRRPRGARREGGTAGASPRGARTRQSAREGGVRRGEGTARDAVRAARGSRGVARRAGEAAQRADRDGRAPVRGDVRVGASGTSPRSRRRCSRVATAGCG